MKATKKLLAEIERFESKPNKTSEEVDAFYNSPAGELQMQMLFKRGRNIFKYL